MSTESLRAFGRQVQVNRELYEKLMKASAAAAAKVAADAGFRFTVEEARDLAEQASAELADEQLEAVAGGLVGLPFSVTTRPKT